MKIVEQNIQFWRLIAKCGAERFIVFFLAVWIERRGHFVAGFRVVFLECVLCIFY